MKAVTTNRIIGVVKRCALRLRNDQPDNPDSRYTIWKQLEDLTDGCSDVASRVLRDENVRKLLPFFRRGYANMLFDLEKEWAHKVIKQARPDLRSYPKYTQYELRVDLEMLLLRVLSGKEIENVILCGCGPFPVSAAILKGRYGATVDLLDKSRTALELADELLQCVSLRAGTAMHCVDVCSFDHLHNYDAVFLAGTVGLGGREKTRIARHIYARLKPGAFLVLREPVNLDKLLVAEVNASAIAVNNVVWVQLTGAEDCLRRAFLRKPSQA